MDKRSGGVSADEFERFCREQTRARIMTPGPIPIVWHDFVVDTLQIEQAAALGTAAITLFPEMVPEDTSLATLIELCNSFKIEPIVMIKSKEEFDLAYAGPRSSSSSSNSGSGVNVGARVFCLHSLNETALVDLRQQLPDDPSFLYGAKLRPETQFSMYTEIETAWLLRDTKFNFVWPSPDAVYATGTLCLRFLPFFFPFLSLFLPFSLSLSSFLNSLLLSLLSLPFSTRNIKVRATCMA